MSYSEPDPQGRGFDQRKQSDAEYARDMTGMPVDVEQAAPAKGLSRLDNQPPVYSGARVRSPQVTENGDEIVGCTTGAAFESTEDGTKEWISTAYHCFRPGPAGNTIYTGNLSSDPLNKITLHDTELDIGLIPKNSNSTAWRGNQDTTSYLVPVTTVAYSFNDQLVCQDGWTSAGAVGGAVCGIEVIDDFIVLPFESSWLLNGAPYQYDVTGVLARKVGGVAAREGDSGGLVFKPNSDNTQLQARGNVVASVIGDPSTMFFAETMFALSLFNVRLADR